MTCTKKGLLSTLGPGGVENDFDFHNTRNANVRDIRFHCNRCLVYEYVFTIIQLLINDYQKLCMKECEDKNMAEKLIIEAVVVSQEG